MLLDERHRHRARPKHTTCAGDAGPGTSPEAEGRCAQMVDVRSVLVDIIGVGLPLGGWLVGVASPGGGVVSLSAFHR
jgi:hypothetical protein